MWLPDHWWTSYNFAVFYFEFIRVCVKFVLSILSISSTSFLKLVHINYHKVASINRYSLLCQWHSRFIVILLKWFIVILSSTENWITINHFRRITINLERHWRSRLYYVVATKGNFWNLKLENKFIAYDKHTV